jgi:hypothetical protein
MIGTPLVFANVSLLFALALRLPIFAQSSGLRVYEDARHNVHVVLPSGKDTIIARFSPRLAYLFTRDENRAFCFWRKWL